ncbi:MAG: hypothetical protein KTU85_10455 [Acidimicrobiia bacterium]|nr:hypothetical protein [Acidimicrobiia bacterium]MCY4457819.1 hypothetical protein [Acidimicrobiaceae bacterium]
MCGNCGERFLEEHDEFDGRLTRRLARRLIGNAQVIPVRAVVRHHGVAVHLTLRDKSRVFSRCIGGRLVVAVELRKRQDRASLRRVG